MRDRVGKGDVRRFGKRGRVPGVLMLGLLASTLAPASLAAQDPPRRVVRVELAFDRGIDNRAEWRIAATRLLGDCFRTFRGWFPIDLRLEDVVAWSPGPGRRPLAERLGEMRRNVRRGSCEIVLGVISPERAATATLGIASYARADILVMNLVSREAMRYVVLHELCHVFGAADIREKGALMDIERPALFMDDWTSRVVRLNAGRSFGPGFPILPGASLDGLIALFEGRAGRGLGEPEVPLLLTLFYLEKNDLEAAARACAAAAEADPRFPAIHNLTGTVLMLRGETDLAIEEYRKAVQAEPYEPGVLFNLGLAFVEKGLLEEAAEAYRQALKVDPGCDEARRALGLVMAAGQDVHAARAAVQPFVLALRRGK